MTTEAPAAPLPILVVSHADTCLPDYWGGHHLPHVQIPAFHGMTLDQIRAALISEVAEGAIAGADYDAEKAGAAWDAAAYKAIEAKVAELSALNGADHAYFTQLSPATHPDWQGEGESDDVTVYAYFVFVDMTPTAEV